MPKTTVKQPEAEVVETASATPEQATAAEPTAEPAKPSAKTLFHVTAKERDGYTYLGSAVVWAKNSVASKPGIAAIPANLRAALVAVGEETEGTFYKVEDRAGHVWIEYSDEEYKETGDKVPAAKRANATAEDIQNRAKELLAADPALAPSIAFIRAAREKGLSDANIVGQLSLIVGQDAAEKMVEGA